MSDGLVAVLDAVLLDESQPDLPWHQDVIDRDPTSEEKRQLKFRRDMNMCAPAVFIFAVPNAGKRSQWEAMKAKREGMKAGVSDLIAIWQGGLAFLEFKDGRSYPTPAQRGFLNRAFRMGHPCGVFRRSDSAMRFLAACGAPFLIPPSQPGETKMIGGDAPRAGGR